jgi:hypothetical protein
MSRRIYLLDIVHLTPSYHEAYDARTWIVYIALMYSGLLRVTARLSIAGVTAMSSRMLFNANASSFFSFVARVINLVFLSPVMPFLPLTISTSSKCHVYILLSRMEGKSHAYIGIFSCPGR